MANYDSAQLKRLEPAYLAQYGLNEAPFSSQHDDNFLYLDAERHQRLEMLTHLTQYSNLLLIVTGERGVGKTSLLRRFCSSADESWYLCEVNAHTMMDADSMLTEIAGGFGLNGLPNDPSTVQEIVFEHLKALQHDELVPILMIDDAHELPKDALETLFYFADIEAAQGHLLRIILFCEPQIDIMLESPSIRPLRERITHTLEINPFDEDQTAEFIKHRMAVAGFEGTSPFTPKVIKKIHKISRGIPSHICELAHLHLDDAASLNNTIDLSDPADLQDLDNNDPFGPDQYNSDQYNPDQFSADDLGYNTPDSTQSKNDESNSSAESNFSQAAFSTRHYVFIAIVAIVSIIVFSMQDTINKAIEPTDTALDTINKNLPSAIKNKPLISKPKEITLKGPVAIPSSDLPPTPELEDEPVKQSTEITNTLKGNVKPDTDTPTQQAKFENSDAPTSTPIEYVLDEVVPNPVNGNTKAQTITLTGSGFKSGSQAPSVWISWTGKSKALKKHQYKIIDDTTIELNITVGLNPDEWSAQLKQNNIESNTITFAVIKPKAQPAKVTNLAGLKDERWILDQEPNHFTLQVLGTKNKNSIKTFTTKHQLNDSAAVFQTLRNGKPWYSVIFGSYATKDAAAKSKKKITNSKVKPWLRRFDSVQAKINTEKIDSAPVKPKAIVTIKANKKTTQAVTAITNQPIGKIEDSAAWLWSQDPRGYTLQLLGGRNDKSIQKFIQKYKLKGKAIYFHTKHNERNWYALVYGSYTTRSAALQAIKNLPIAIQKTSPWARSFASIHKDLDQSQ